MSDEFDPIRITNCHIHAFTTNHVPAGYPNRVVALLGGVPGVLQVIADGTRIVAPVAADRLDRLIAFNREARRSTQRRVFEGLKTQYPSDTRFVILPMDMELMGFGPVAEDLDAQHEELFALAEAYPDQVIPFCTVHPDREDAAERVERYFDRGAKGLKLYPRLDYAPTHETLMQQIYPMVRERDLPVLSHCSRGGVSERRLSRQRGDRLCAPGAMIEVLDAFPELRINLAHFGGQDDWLAYVKGEAGDDNWLSAIRKLIGEGNYPGLWADISYTLFFFDDLAPFLRMFLLGNGDWNKRVRERVLFGSDYYMTRNRALSEREVSVRLRQTLGEALFRQIAETNPEVWLG